MLQPTQKHHHNPPNQPMSTRRKKASSSNPDAIAAVNAAVNLALSSNPKKAQPSNPSSSTAAAAPKKAPPSNPSSSTAAAAPKKAPPSNPSSSTAAAAASKKAPPSNPSSSTAAPKKAPPSNPSSSTAATAPKKPSSLTAAAAAPSSPNPIVNPTSPNPVSPDVVNPNWPWGYTKHYSALLPVPKPTFATTVALYRPPWSISPKQTGTVLKPSIPDFCRIHNQMMAIRPTDNIHTMLPFELIGNRRWNLPYIQSYLLHSGRAPGISGSDRPIVGRNAYWKVRGIDPVVDVFGNIVGYTTELLLVFGEDTHRTESGIWKAVEYTCLDKIDGDCCVIVLSCLNPKLVMLEEAVLLAEYQIGYSLQKSCENNYTRKQVVLDYTDEISPYVETLGARLAEYHQVRRMLEDKEIRMTRFVFDPPAEEDHALVVEPDFGRKYFRGWMQAGSRVGGKKGKGKKGKGKKEK